MTSGFLSVDEKIRRFTIFSVHGKYRKHVSLVFHLLYLRIGSCLVCEYRVVDARDKFGEHERSVKVARGVTESKSSLGMQGSSSSLSSIIGDLVEKKKRKCELHRHN